MLQHASIIYLPIDEEAKGTQTRFIQLAEQLSDPNASNNQPTLCLLHANKLNTSALAQIKQHCKQYSQSVCVLLSQDTDQDTLLDAYHHGLDHNIILPITDALLRIKITQFASAQQLQLQQREKQQQLETILTRIQQEEGFARHVYESMTGGAIAESKDYFSLQRSASGFCGDFLFDVSSPIGIRYVFLADAMGHGLAAALSIVPVINVVKAMAHRSMPLAAILQEVNRRLNAELPDDRFVSMAAIEVSPYSNLVSVVNAGLPAIFVGQNDASITQCHSNCLPLGIALGAGFSFEPYTFDLNSLSSLLMYSDGLIEQENSDGHRLTKLGLETAIAQWVERKTSWQAVAELFEQHAGAQQLSDDVTCCVIDFAVFNTGEERHAKSVKKNGRVTLDMTITGEYLASTDVPAFVSKFLYQLGIEGRLAGKTFTALAELYQNGLEHGVLNLDSNLKNQTEGFAQYLKAREAALAQLSDEQSIALSLTFNAAEEITASVSDSGKGYAKDSGEIDVYSVHGRGLALVKHLSESVSVNEVGNSVKIVIKD